MYKQSPLPGFPDGAQKVGTWLSILDKDGTVTYFLGGDNYFSHPKGDKKSERFVLTSLMENGHARARDLERSFLGIPYRTLMNGKARYREDGPASLFRAIGGPKPKVLTPETIAECAALLADGHRPSVVARRAGIEESTLRKALKRQGVPRVTKNAADEPTRSTASSSKSERSRADAEAAEGMGTARARADERIAAAMGLVESATARFEAGHDAQMAGLLSGLPALCANGLLTGLGKHLNPPKGLYSALHILLTLGFMPWGAFAGPKACAMSRRGNWSRSSGWIACPRRARSGKRSP